MHFIYECTLVYIKLIIKVMGDMKFVHYKIQNTERMRYKKRKAN